MGSAPCCDWAASRAKLQVCIINTHWFGLHAQRTHKAAELRLAPAAAAMAEERISGVPSTASTATCCFPNFAPFDLLCDRARIVNAATGGNCRGKRRRPSRRRCSVRSARSSHGRFRCLGAQSSMRTRETLRLSTRRRWTPRRLRAPLPTWVCSSDASGPIASQIRQIKSRPQVSKTWIDGKRRGKISVVLTIGGRAETRHLREKQR